MLPSAKQFEKDPGEIITYDIAWNKAMRSDDKVVASEWQAPADLTITFSAHDDKTSQVSLAGGVAGETYTVSCKVVLEGGQVLRRAFYLKIVEMQFLTE